MKTLLAIALAGLLAFGASTTLAQQAKTKTVAALYKEKAALAGQLVRVQGKVVKVNNGIMGRNFLHVQDGSGDKTSNDLTVTSNQTAKIGDQVTVTGKVVVNKDFGSGYSYPLMLEEASIAAAK
jgi:hypothetical protein